MGPEIQHTAEKLDGPVTLWVYTGADASFELYEDDGLTYGYEQGAFSDDPDRLGREGGHPDDRRAHRARTRACRPRASSGRVRREGPARRPLGRPPVAATLRYEGAPCPSRS
jgi:hypothetical protein